MTRFAFASARPARRPSLTPMIDVVFLLLVFFMLAARFGTDTAIALSLPAASQNAEWKGPPRLVQFSEESVSLNGLDVRAETLIENLAPLMSAQSDPILLQADPAATTQRLIDMIELLRHAGFTSVIVVE